MFKNIDYTYVHGDFRPANILYSNFQKKYYIIDFENFMIGDSFFDVYKFLSILKVDSKYMEDEVYSFLCGYYDVRKNKENFVKKWMFYDIYYSLRTIRRAINEKTFYNSKDKYIIDACKNIKRQNEDTINMKKILEKYF